ncbi:MAG: glutathione S-transferase family protein [Pseudomonadota bacterium]
MKPTLYYAPGVCSLASHIAFEEAGVEVDYVRLDLSRGDVRQPDYLKLNPKGRVPLVVTDRGVLTESPAILAWIAQTWPHAALAPLDDPWALAQVNAFNAYLSGTLHGLAFAGVFQPGRFVDGEAAQAALKTKAMQTVRDTLALIEGKLADEGWIHGAYSTSDPYLAVLSGWLAHTGESIEQFPRIAAHARRVRARPAARRAFAREGLET